MTITAYAENVASTVSVDPGKVLAYPASIPATPRARPSSPSPSAMTSTPCSSTSSSSPRAARTSPGTAAPRRSPLRSTRRVIPVDQEPRLSEDGKEWSARVSVYRKDMGHRSPSRAAIR